jgi:hypothetical protein
VREVMSLERADSLEPLLAVLRGDNMLPGRN